MLNSYGSSDYSPATNLYRVAIPSDVDRSWYIDNCRQTNRVSVKNAMGIQHGVLFPIGSFPNLVFPYTYLDDGNLVATNRVPGSDQMVVVAIYPMEGRKDSTPADATTMRSSTGSSSASSTVYKSGVVEVEAVSSAGSRVEVTALGEGAVIRNQSQGNIETHATDRIRIQGSNEIDLLQSSGRMSLVSSGIRVGHTKSVQLDIKGEDGNSTALISMDDGGRVSIASSGAHIVLDKDGRVSVSNGEQSVREILQSLVELLDGVNGDIGMVNMAIAAKAPAPLVTANNMTLATNIKRVMNDIDTLFSGEKPK